jgi:hypothetical protein
VVRAAIPSWNVTRARFIDLDEGGTMKGLATALLFIGWSSAAAFGGPLEMSFGGGPSAIMLDAINESIGVFNALIEHLNETFAVHPDVSGSVKLVPSIGGGLYFQGAERYWATDWFAIGGHVGYSRASTATTGFYEGAEVSEITVDLAFQAVGGVLGAEATFLDMGLRLGAFGGIGYYYVLMDRVTVFEIPSEYPDVIAGVPPDAEGRYTGSSLGFEAGLSLSYPVADWFTIGSRVTYRSARIRELADNQANVLDLDGDGTGEPVSLSGFTVQLTVSINIDLSLDGRKE